MKPTTRSSKLLLRLLDAPSLALVTGGDGDPIASNLDRLSAGIEPGRASSDVVTERIGPDLNQHRRP